MSDMNLAQFRALMNLSRKDVAEMSGLTQARIWKLEQLGDNTEIVLEGKNLDDYKIAWDSLITFQTENPNGKPKATPKAKAPKVSNTAILAELAELVGKIDEAIADLKAKKAGTSHLAQVKIELENLITKNS